MAIVIHELIAEWDRAIKAIKVRNEDGLIEEIYREQKLYFARIDRTLDACQHGPDWLKRSGVAQLVASKIQAADTKLYDLLAYCIMPNHVHLVVDTATQVDELPY